MAHISCVVLAEDDDARVSASSAGGLGVTAPEEGEKEGAFHPKHTHFLHCVEVLFGNHVQYT